MIVQELLCFKKWALAAVLPALATLSITVRAQVASGSSGMPAPAGTIWTKVATPDPGTNNILESLSADSEQDIWAVGDFVSLRFDGTNWSAIPLAVPQGEATIDGVTAISPTDVWAAGSTSVGAPGHLLTVIEHFDGTKWTIVPSPQFSTGSELQKVLAFSANDVYAVGDFHSDRQEALPMVLHFDGAKWSVVALPTLSKGQHAALTAIGGISNTDFWVAGAGSVAGSNGTPLVLHFDGQQFTPVSFPVNSVEFGGIAAIATDDVWATGNDGQTMAAHWDGKVWTRFSTPIGGAGTFSSLRGLSAISSTDVWASGDVTDFRHGFLSQNLVEHFDGHSWTISPTPPSNIQFNQLTSALAFSDGSVFVAGSRLHCVGNFCAGFDSVVFHTTKGK